MRNQIIAAGVVAAIMASAAAASTGETRLRERCSANRCVFYEPGKGRVASVSRDRAGRVVIQRPYYRGGDRIVIRRDRNNRGTIRIQEDRRQR